MNNILKAEPAFTAMDSPLKRANQAFRLGDFSTAISLYIETLQATPALTKTVVRNLTAAQYKYWNCIPTQRQRTAILTSHGVQPSARIAILTQHYARMASSADTVSHVHSAAALEAVPQGKSARTTFAFNDDSTFATQAIAHVSTHPYAIIHLVNPGAIDVLLGVLYKLLWGATILIDLDGDEFAAQASNKVTSKTPPFTDKNGPPGLDQLSSDEWTGWAHGLVTEFDGITVGSALLQAVYGGELIIAEDMHIGTSALQDLIAAPDTPRTLRPRLIQPAQALANWLRPLLQDQLTYHRSLRSIETVNSPEQNSTTSPSSVAGNAHTDWWRSPFSSWHQPRASTPALRSIDGNDAELRHFGAAFLGPVLAAFFSLLSKKFHQDAQPASLNFLAREGYFLELVYRRLVDERLIMDMPSRYLLCSRTLLFKLALAKPSLWTKLLNHHYSGNIAMFFKNRFAFTEQEIDQIRRSSATFQRNASQHIELPSNRGVILGILREANRTLEQIVKPKLDGYLQYLREIGFAQGKEEHVVDLGYAGTIQSLLSDLTGNSTVGHYFITTTKAKNSAMATYHGYLLNNIAFGDNHLLLDRSLYLESLLTAPHGSVIDLRFEDGKTAFLFGKETTAQARFSDLDAVVAGATDYVVDAIRENVAMEPAELSEYYGKFVSHAVNFPSCTWDLFEIDDAISGLGIINPIHFFKKN